MTIYYIILLLWSFVQIYCAEICVSFKMTWYTYPKHFALKSGRLYQMEIRLNTICRLFSGDLKIVFQIPYRLLSNTKTCKNKVWLLLWHWKTNEQWDLSGFCNSHSLYFHNIFFRRDVLKGELRKDQARSNAWPWNVLRSEHDIIAKKSCAAKNIV